MSCAGRLLNPCLRWLLVAVAKARRCFGGGRGGPSGIPRRLVRAPPCPFPGWCKGGFHFSPSCGEAHPFAIAGAASDRSSVPACSYTLYADGAARIRKSCAALTFAAPLSMSPVTLREVRYTSPTNTRTARKRRKKTRIVEGTKLKNVYTKVNVRERWRRRHIWRRDFKVARQPQASPTSLTLHYRQPLDQLELFYNLRRISPVSFVMSAEDSTLDRCR